LDVVAIKAKIDTGARSSAVHAFDITVVRDQGRDLVRFKLHPSQHNQHLTVAAEAPLYEYRRVRSSAGHESLRPVILTEIELLGERWMIELTLAGRDTMGFRMLLGRQALRHRFVVDPGRSYMGGRRKR
jgi:hypothetical protein